MGAGLLDLGGAEVDCAFSVDGSQPIGTVITRALGQQAFTIEVRGRAAHAAANPEAGVTRSRWRARSSRRCRWAGSPGGGSASIAAIVGGAVIDRLGAALGRRRGGRFEPHSTRPRPTRFRIWCCCAASCAATATPSSIRRGSALEAVAARVCAERGADYQLARPRARRCRRSPAPATRGRWRSPARPLSEVSGVTFATTEAHATLEANYLAASTDVVALASGGSGPHQFTESITVAELDALEALLTRIVELAGSA